MNECGVTGCSEAHFGKGYCVGHYARWRRNGTPQPHIPLGGQRPARKREDIKYRGAHKRVTREWGRADQYPCVSCGMAAREWAYDYSDETAIVENELVYSQWPEFYMPMCHSCHLKMDRNRDGYVWRSKKP